MLRFAMFSQFDCAQFWIVLFIITALLSEITWYVLQFDKRQSYALPASSAHFRMPFTCFWFWIPRNKPNKDSTEARCTRFRLKLKVSKRIRAIALLNIQLWILDLTHMHFNRPDIANARRRYFWCMQWHKKVIAELIALYYINFH